MKTSKRPTPLDMLSVDEGTRRISIFRNGHKLLLVARRASGDTTHEFTFDQLFALIEQLRPGIAETVIGDRELEDLRRLS